MKKTIILFSLCVGVAAMATAQEEQPAAKKYLPQAGDFALGVDATPFLKYVGGLFSDNGTTAPTFSGLQGQGIYAKYFLEDNRAIRAKLLLDIYTSSSKQSVQNDEAINTTPGATAIDTRKNGVTNVNLAVGYEFRRGRGRVQGFYGGELSVGLGKNSTTYEYGNPMTAANPSPSTYPNFSSNSANRTLENNGGLNFAFGLGGFVGVEYFVANQLSLGGEFTLGLAASIRGQDEITTQRVEAGEVREFSTRSRNGNQVSNTFGVRTVTGGNIFLIFYF
jgi:hypothetical protein